MTGAVDTLIRKYGESLRVTDADGAVREGFGILTPLRPASRGDEHRHTRPGIAQPRRYRLIAQSGVFRDGDSGREVLCGGHSYQVMRAEPIRLCGSLTHWECILRRKDVPEHD